MLNVRLWDNINPDVLDSKQWNNYWRDELDQVISQRTMDAAGYYYLKSEDAKAAAVKYFITGKSSDYRAFLSQTLSDHWSDPVEVVGSLLAFADATVRPISSAPSSSYDPYSNHGKNCKR